jgi:hypothetical protein
MLVNIQMFYVEADTESPRESSNIFTIKKMWAYVSH